ncbi:hypothetical protein BN1723_003705, partial [Verticillium longisporum]
SGPDSNGERGKGLFDILLHELQLACTALGNLPTRKSSQTYSSDDLAHVETGSRHRLHSSLSRDTLLAASCSDMNGPRSSGASFPRVKALLPRASQWFEAEATPYLPSLKKLVPIWRQGARGPGICW